MGLGERLSTNKRGHIHKFKQPFRDGTTPFVLDPLEVIARLEAEGGSLPEFVRQEFDAYLKCGLLQHGFLRVKCDVCSQASLSFHPTYLVLGRRP